MPDLLTQVLLVAFGGSAGAVTRLLVDVVVTTRLGQLLPWATFLINVSGCFLLGLVLGSLHAGAVHPLARPLVATGFLGAYTTFSTFGAETIVLLEEGSVGLAVVYVGGSVILGLLATAGGLALGRSLA